VAEGVQYDPVFSNAVFSVSENGALLCQTGTSSSARNMTLWDVSGKSAGGPGDAASYFAPRISPDSKRVAVSLIDPHTGKADIWIYDLALGSRSRLTVDPTRAMQPVWSRDGTAVAYDSLRSGQPAVYLKPSDGMGEERELWEPPLGAAVNDWTLDSKTLILQERSQASGKYRLLLFPADGKAGPAPLLELQGANIRSAQLSADGHWIAYESDESGKFEIYVSPFPKPVGRLQLSVAGGREPHWRRDGRQLYYLEPDGKLQAAELKEINGSLQAVALRTLFQTKATAPTGSFDVFPDGKKFLFDTISTVETPTPLSLVLNWTVELKK